MVDNLKSAVLKRIVGRAPVFNPACLDFAGHCGFSIAACAVGKGNEKGRVESGAGYVRKNFLGGLDITDFSILKPGITHWPDTIANVRKHGETGEKPVERFEKEQGYPAPLARTPYDIGVIRQVRASRRFRVTLDTNRYSVPAQYAGERLTMKVYPDRLCIYHEDRLIARRLRCYDRRKDFEQPDHVKPLLTRRRKARDRHIFKRFLALSNKAEAYCREMQQRRMDALHHIRRIVTLSDIYDPDSVTRAVDDAFELKAFSSEYIVNLLEQRTRRLPEPGPLHLTRREDLLDLSIEQPDLSIYEIYCKIDREAAP